MRSGELIVVAGVAMLISCGSALAQSSIPYPQPIISEVLFAVPNDDSGDANGDGVRDAVGDEFIELFNPHDQAIDLKGVVLTSRRADPRNPGDKKGVSFVFPRVLLEPGRCVVVFNGLDANIAGPVGTSARAPEAGNPGFGGALVFSMGNRSQGRALANTGDFVLLSVGDGAVPVECVLWGEAKEKPPRGTTRVFEAEKSPDGSVVRVGDGPDAVFVGCVGAERVVASPGVRGGGE